MNFSLLNPYFLIGLGAIAIPVIAHLISKTAGIEKRFAAMNFLLASKGESARLSKFKDLILLLLRSLILVLLVLVFAKPAVLSISHADSHYTKSVVFVIDNSFSMGYKDNFDKAKRYTKEQIESLADGSFGTVIPLVQFDNTQPSLTQDKNVMKQELRKIKLSNTYVDNERRIEEVFGLLQASPNEIKEVVFITDFQKNGWNSDKFIRNWLVPIDITKGENLGNLAITETNFKEVGDSIRIDLKVTNFSKIPTTKILATVDADNKKLNGLFDIQPEGSEIKEFIFNKEQLTQGEIIGDIEISPDELIVDNHRYFVFPKDQELRVLIVDGDPREISRLGETYYISRALETLSDLLGLNISVKDNDAFLIENLEKFNLIFLANVGDVTPEKSMEIEKFIETGGVIVIFVGNRVRSNVYNRLFKKILPAELSTISEGDYTLKTGESDNYLGKNNEKFKKVKVNKLYNLIPNDDSSTLLYASDGSSFLLRKDYGRGAIFLFASTADLNWNNLPISPVFLPTIKTIFDLSTAKKSVNRNLRVGEKTTLDFTNDMVEVTVTNPSGEKFKIGRINPEFTNTLIPGLYTVENEGRILYSIAVNVDTKESNLEKISLEVPHSEELSVSSYVKVFKEIWRYFLWATIILFTSESIFRVLGQ
ncbi:BatA domain-containing protein [Desulfobacterota bacterium AH_259_B03_O07]|nr:BatA domain-containing protein [Desulfobacterota bacterium AH_259_B03_O07]